MIVLQYFGKHLLQNRIMISRVMKNKLPYCNIQIVFQTKCEVTDIFTFKGKIPVFLSSGIVHKFKCSGCSATYYSKTKLHFKFRMSEYGVSALTGKS